MTFRLYANLGNTSAHLGLWRDRWVIEQRLRVRELADDADWREALERVLAQAGLSSSDCDGALICASTPRRSQLQGAIESVCRTRALLLGWDITLEMPVEYDDPTTFGPDRLLAAFAAGETVGRPCVVLDAGTCVTCDAMSAEGVVLPIGIASGLPALMVGVAEAAPHLIPALEGISASDLEAVRTPARSTEESLAAGLASCFAGLGDALIRLAFKALENDGDAVIAATGGDGGLLAKLVTHPLRHEPMLSLDGLRMLDERRSP